MIFGIHKMVRTTVIDNNIGIFLRKARKEKSLSGKDLAKLMHVSQQQISRYELGITSLTLDQLNKLLILLDKTWIELILYVELHHFDENELKHLI